MLSKNLFCVLQIFLILDDLWYLWTLPIKLKTLHQDFICVSFVRRKHTFIKVPRSFCLRSQVRVFRRRSRFDNQIIIIRGWHDLSSHHKVINKTGFRRSYFLVGEVLMSFQIILKSNRKRSFSIFNDLKIVVYLDRWHHSCQHIVSPLLDHQVRLIPINADATIHKIIMIHDCFRWVDKCHLRPPLTKPAIWARTQPEMFFAPLSRLQFRRQFAQDVRTCRIDILVWSQESLSITVPLISCKMGTQNMVIPLQACSQDLAVLLPKVIKGEIYMDQSPVVLKHLGQLCCSIIKDRWL